MRLHSLLWARSKLTKRLHTAERVRDTVSAQSPPLDELFRVQSLMRQLERARAKALRVVGALTAAQQDPALASLADALQGTSSVRTT